MLTRKLTATVMSGMMLSGVIVAAGVTQADAATTKTSKSSTCSSVNSQRRGIILSRQSNKIMMDKYRKLADKADKQANYYFAEAMKGHAPVKNTARANQQKALSASYYAKASYYSTQYHSTDIKFSAVSAKAKSFGC